MFEATAKYNKTNNAHKKYYHQGHEAGDSQVELLLHNGYISRNNIFYGKACIIILR